MLDLRTGNDLITHYEILRDFFRQLSHKLAIAQPKTQKRIKLVSLLEEVFYDSLYRLSHYDELYCFLRSTKNANRTVNPDE